MIDDYCQRLQQLNKDKNDFIKLKYKTNAKNHIDQQENKYHKYILTQIAYKNRLDALLKITLQLNQTINAKKRTAFNLILNSCLRNSQAQKSLSKSNRNDLTQTHSQADSEKTIHSSTQSLKQRLKHTSLTLIAKWAQNYDKASMIIGFRQIKRKTNQIKKIQNIGKLIRRKNQFQQNVFFQHIKSIKSQDPKKIDNQTKEHRSFIFSLNEFSQIIPYTIEEESQQLSTSRIKNIQQIDQKFSPLSQSNIISSETVSKGQNEHKIMLESFEKLKEEVFLMKNLVNEKNKLLKHKEELIYKMKKEYETKIETLHDQISSKIQHEYLLRQSNVSKVAKKNSSKSGNLNESYLKQLQTHIIGDRSPRGNQFEQDPVSHQLLQKYMKESFEMREKMDVAREMCEQFEFDSRTDEGQIMMEIIKLLTPEERLNAYVD